MYACVAVLYHLVTHITYPPSAGSAIVACLPIKAEPMLVGLWRCRLQLQRPGVRHGCMPMRSFVCLFVHLWIRPWVDAAASKHGRSSLLLADGMVLRPGMDSVGGQDIRSRAISIRAGSRMPRCCCNRFFNLFRPSIFHSNTDVTATLMKCRVSEWR